MFQKAFPGTHILRVIPHIQPSFRRLASQLELRPGHLWRACPGEELWSLLALYWPLPTHAHLPPSPHIPPSTHVLPDEKGPLFTLIPRSRVLQRTAS